MRLEDWTDVEVVVDYKFTTFTMPLEDWISERLFDNPSYALRAVQCSDGQRLPITKIPLRYRGTRLANLLYRIGYFR